MINEKDWRTYASNVRNNIVVIMLFSIVKSVVDFVGGIGSSVSDLMSFVQSGTVDFGADMCDIIGYATTFVIVIAYFSYMSGLSNFAEIQANDDDSCGVRRIRSGMVWTLLSIVVNYIPMLGRFLSSLFLFIAFFVLLSGYSKLKNSLTFPVKARRGAGVLFGSMFVQLIGNILDWVPIVGDLLEGLFSFIAFCMVLNGWKKIKKADVNETPMTQMARKMGVAPQAVQPVLQQDVEQESVQQHVVAPEMEMKTQTIVDEKPTSLSKETQQQMPQSKPIESTKKSNKVLIGVISGIVLLAALVIGYFVWYAPYAKDRDALRTYVLATNVFLRSEKTTENEYNIIAKVPYGSELITYAKDAEWAEVKYGQITGYVASAFLLEKGDFEKLDSIWGNDEAIEYIESSKCRLALLDYCKRNNLATGASGWQLKTLSKDVKPNYALFPRLANGYDRYTEFAFILTNHISGERLCAVYSFDEETEQPIFLYEDLINTDKRIKNIKYNAQRKQYIVVYEAPTIPTTNKTKPASDVILYELKGNVQKVDVVEYEANDAWELNKDIIKNSYSISFDKNGIAKRYDNYFYYGDDNKNVNVTRDTKGRVIKLDNLNVLGDGTSYVFTYDSNGNISSQDVKSGFTYTYNSTCYYDNNNRIEKEIIKDSDVEYEGKRVIKYTYIKDDANGNWIERRVFTQQEIKETDAASEAFSIRNKQQYRIEKRVILYY